MGGPDSVVALQDNDSRPWGQVRHVRSRIDHDARGDDAGCERQRWFDLVSAAHDESVDERDIRGLHSDEHLAGSELGLWSRFHGDAALGAE